MGVEAEISKIVKGREVEFTIYGEKCGCFDWKKREYLEFFTVFNKTCGES